VNGVPVITDKMVLDPTQGQLYHDGTTIVLQDALPARDRREEVILARSYQSKAVFFQDGGEIGGAWSPIRWNSLQGIDQKRLLARSLEQGGDRPDEAGTIIRFVTAPPVRARSWSSAARMGQRGPDQPHHEHRPAAQNDEDLGGWINVQRKKFDKDSEHGKTLSAIGFSSDALEASWQMKFDLLVAYKKKNGHCNVPQNDEDLGGWINAQRMKFDKDSEHGKKLSAIGFSSDAREARWQEKFDLLVAYRKKNGHCNVPRSDKDSGIWVNSQRRNCDEDSERGIQLSAIGFCWSIHKKKKIQV